jgi:aminopeptidase YwaD
LQQGVAAISLSSQWFLDNIDTQTITHTPNDLPELIDPQKLVDTAECIARFIHQCARDQ